MCSLLITWRKCCCFCMLALSPWPSPVHRLVPRACPLVPQHGLCIRACGLMAKTALPLAGRPCAFRSRSALVHVEDLQDNAERTWVGVRTLAISHRQAGLAGCVTTGRGRVRAAFRFRPFSLSVFSSLFKLSFLSCFLRHSPGSVGVSVPSSPRWEVRGWF